MLSARPHGEDAAIVEVLTAHHGRHAGLVRGAVSRRLRAVVQPGNRVQASWRARLADQLGGLTLEADRDRTAAFLDDPAKLDALAALCALARATLPEREPHGDVYAGLDVVLDAVALAPNGDAGATWAALIVKWEVGLLGALGFGLELDRCALTGRLDELSHVSPKTGRAVCGDAPEAAPFRDKLLKLPPFLLGNQAGVVSGDIADGLALSGHFLERRVLWPTDRTLPDARARLAARFAARTAGL